MRRLGFIAAAALLLWPSLSGAQEPRTGQEAIPSVDEFEVPPEERLVAFTLGLYDAVIANDGGECPSFAPIVQDYLDTHGNDIENAANQLAAATEFMTDEEKQAMAAYVRAELSADPRVEEAQAILYPCLRSGEVQGHRRPLDRQMDRFYRLHQKLMDAWVGNVD